jgi:hypothetical protein
MSDISPQAQTPTAPPPPTTPAPGGVTTSPAPAGTPAADIGVMQRVPQTEAEIRALRDQRSELSRQLGSATDRREELVGELDGATGANRAGIEARIRLLDERILQIESDIASTGKLLASARGSTTIQPDPVLPGGNRMNPRDLIPIVAILSVFVFFPIAVAFARNIWRRGSLQKVESAIERENADRLARLESAVDTIAIEMERVSEGQRFVTKLLAESQGREHARIEQK